MKGTGMPNGETGLIPVIGVPLRLCDWAKLLIEPAAVFVIIVPESI